MPRISRSTALHELPVVVLDTETTGVDATSDRLIQIGALRIAEGRIAEAGAFCHLVNPGVPIAPAATAVHGISDADVASAPGFDRIQPELEAFLGDAVLVGQSIGFDLAVLMRETQRIGGRWRPPQFLDTKLLFAVVEKDPTERGLDEIAERFGITVSRRHSALDDARVTAEVFLQLLPRLAEQGIRTLGEAEAHSRAQTRILQRQAQASWYDATSVRPADPWAEGRDRRALSALDPFLYRHTLRHVMRSPPLFLPPQTTVEEAARQMDESGWGAALVGDGETGRAFGIVTERDLLQTLARYGSACAQRRLESVMSEPLVALPEDAFLYRALGRMQRLGIRYLGVADPSGRSIGVVSTRELVKERASEAILLGEALSTAETAQDLARARTHLPDVARQLLDEGVDPLDIARILSVELTELMARAAVLAEQRMELAGAGRPPAPYALLLLGSGGRGESLLAAEPDNALVYASDDPEGAIDGWFARFGDHLIAIAHEAGVSYRADAVMLLGASWRGSLRLWQERIGDWAIDPARALTERADMVFDGRIAYGDEDLVVDLRAALVADGERRTRLAETLAWPSLVPERPPRGVRRIDLKRHVLVPLTSAARALALRHGINARSTTKRLAGICSAGSLSPAERDRLEEVLSDTIAILLRQQIADLAAGIQPTKEVDRVSLGEADALTLERIFDEIAALPATVRRGLCD